MPNIRAELAVMHSVTDRYSPLKCILNSDMTALEQEKSELTRFTGSPNLN